MATKLIQHAPQAYDYPLLIKHLFHTPRAYAQDQEIVYRDVTRHTYREFWERVGRLASGLESLGVKPGNTVAVMDWDSHRYLEAYFAVPMMGAIMHSVNIRLSPEQILYTINHAEDDVILVNADFLPILEAIKDRLTTARTFVVLSDAAERPETSLDIAAEYEELLRGSSPDYEFPDFDENSQATIFHTTGTTGLPKGVYFSHRQLVLHTLGTLGALAASPSGQRLHRGDVYMPITPMFHVHAWGLPYVATMLGVKQVYPGRYAPDVLLRLIKEEGVTFSHCVPTVLHMLLTSPASQDMDLHGWTVVIGGSAPPRSLAKAALDRGIDVFGGYGMSETCPVLTLAQLDPEMVEADRDEELDILTKAGRPLPLVDLRIVDHEMNDVPHDGVSAGEVVVRAPWLTQGYFKDPEHSAELWEGGYLHTRDIGNIDSRGYLRVTDRIKDVIKTGGEWISSLDLEDITAQHEAVNEVAVIAIPDEVWGERPVAIVTLKQGYEGQVSEEDLKTHVKSYVDRGVLSRLAVPDSIRFVQEIDKTSVGKIDKKVLRQKYGQAEEPAPGVEAHAPADQVR